MNQSAIPFTPEMAYAACAGRKSVTRRLIKPAPNPVYWEHPGYILCPTGKPESKTSGQWHFFDRNEKAKIAFLTIKGPQPGAIMPMLTTWAVDARYNHLSPSALPTLANRIDLWHAGLGPKPSGFGRLRAGRFMPLVLRHHMPKVRFSDLEREVRPERLQDLTEAEAVMEGVKAAPTHRDGFIEIIERLNSKGTWQENPWAWRIGFSVLF